MNSSKNSKIFNKAIVLNAIIIIIVGCAVGILYNLLLPNSLPLVYKERQIPTVADSLLFSNPSNSTKNGDAIITNERSDTTLKQVPLNNDNLTEKSNELKNQVEKNETVEISNKSNESKIRTISYEQLLKILDNPNFIIIDARREDEFSKGHIPHSINIYALDNPDNRIPKMMDLPTDKTIIVYCDGGQCDLSHELAREFIEVLHFPKVFIYSGGWEEWTKNQGTK